MVTALLGELQSRDISLVVDGNNLRCKGDKAALTPELMAALREHKGEILALMVCGKCRASLS
jgi:hypothetical protein